MNLISKIVIMYSDEKDRDKFCILIFLSKISISNLTFNSEFFTLFYVLMKLTSNPKYFYLFNFFLSFSLSKKILVSNFAVTIIYSVKHNISFYYITYFFWNFFICINYVQFYKN